jgi:hypothetical protein
MESFRRFTDYHKLYYLKSKNAFLNSLEKTEDTNVIEKNKQVFDFVFETLTSQLKQEDKAVEKMQMREYYMKPDNLVMSIRMAYNE